MSADPARGAGALSIILADLAAHPASSVRQAARRLGMSDRDVYRILKAAEASGRCHRQRETPSAPWLWKAAESAREPPWRYQAASSAAAAAEVHVVEMWTRRTPCKRVLCGELATGLRPDLTPDAATCTECARLLGLRRSSAAAPGDTSQPGS